METPKYVERTGKKNPADWACGHMSYKKFGFDVYRLKDKYEAGDCNYAFSGESLDELMVNFKKSVDEMEEKRMKQTYNLDELQHPTPYVHRSLLDDAQARIDELESRMMVPTVWPSHVVDAMDAAWRNAKDKHGHLETLMAIGAAALRGLYDPNRIMGARPATGEQGEGR